MATRAELRASDADREATATELREHYALGRLSLDEFNHRLDAAFRATTMGDLDQVIGDLPPARQPTTPLPSTPVTGALPGPGSSGRRSTGPGFTGAQGGWTGGRRRRHPALTAILALAAVFLLFRFTVADTGLWNWKFFAIPAPLPALLVVVVFLRGIVRRLFGWGRCGGRGRRPW
jgi:uncharacterized protein DUF1707